MFMRRIIPLLYQRLQELLLLTATRHCRWTHSSVPPVSRVQRGLAGGSAQAVPQGGVPTEHLGREDKDQRITLAPLAAHASRQWSVFLSADEAAEQEHALRTD